MEPLEKVETEVINYYLRENLKKNSKRKLRLLPNHFLNLISIKGVGPISAAVFIAATRNINDLYKPEKLTSYFGVVPRINRGISAANT